MDEQVIPNLCINLPMVLDKEKEQYSIKENIFQLEQGDILQVNINLYEAVSNSKFPKQLIISAKWGKSLTLISRGVLCKDRLIEYREGQNIVVPVEVIDNKVCITFYLKVDIAKELSAEFQAGVNYTFLNKKTGSVSNIRFYSSKIYMDFIRCMVKLILRNCGVTGHTNCYELDIENKGDITITDVICNINIPETSCYIKDSLYINGEKPLYESCYRDIRLYDVSAGEKVKVGFCIDNRDIRCHESIYVDMQYSYIKQRKVNIKVKSNPLPLGIDYIKPKICDDNKIKIRQTVEVCECKGEGVFRFKVDITKRKGVCILNCIMMYILYYRLKIIPNTLKVNEVYIKGSIKNLRLKFLEGKCEKAEVKIQFDAKIKNEFYRGYILNPEFCSTSHLRVRYTDENYIRNITPVSCVGTSQKCCANKVDLL